MHSESRSIQKCHIHLCELNDELMLAETVPMMVLLVVAVIAVSAAANGARVHPPQGAQLTAPSSLRVGGGPCQTDIDCHLNGICPASDAVASSSSCVCDAAWTGRQCELLNVLPAAASVKGGAYGFSPNVTSWGGNP